MRDIFTYPNNSATYYIDPDYWASVVPVVTPIDGFSKRIADLSDGTYKAFVDSRSWLGSYTNIARDVSRFNTGYYKTDNISGDNLAIYDIWEMPQFVFSKELAENTVSSITYEGYNLADADGNKTGIVKISNFLVNRDPAESPAGGWEMPHGTRFRLWDFNQYVTDSDEIDFYVNIDNGLGNYRRLQTTSLPATDDPNWANWYKLEQADAGGTSTRTLVTGGSTSHYQEAIVHPIRINSTRSVTDGGKTLTYTDDGDQVLQVYTQNTSDYSDGDPWNAGDYFVGAHDDLVQLSWVNDVNNNKISGTNDHTNYADVNADNVTIDLYTDSALTTRSPATFNTYPIGDSDEEYFEARAHSNNTAIDYNFTSYLIIGYTDVPSGLIPAKPAPNLTSSFVNRLEAYVKRFADDSDTANFDEYYFPALVRCQNSISDWTWNAGYRFYRGSYDYDTLAWCRVQKHQITTMGYDPYYAWLITIEEKPDAGTGYDSGHIDLDISAGVSYLTFRFALPEAIKVKFTHPNDFLVAPSAPNNKATISPLETNRYRIADQIGYGLGNLSYKNRTGASTYANAAVFNGKYYEPGNVTEYDTTTRGETNMDLTINQNSNGYITSVGLPSDSTASAPGGRGLYLNDEDIIAVIETSPDTYTPPALTPAEQEDVFDTDDEWASYSWEGGAKVWPTHVTPASAEIVYNSPTIVNNSQSGIKYTRSAGHTDWRLEVTYPPMNADDFQKFHAIAQAGQGQAMPFYFNLVGRDGEDILWRDFFPGGTSRVRFKEPADLGDTTALLEGYASNESNAMVRGEVFIDGKNENGRLHTALNTVDANIYGEAKIRKTWPFREAQQAGWQIFRHPLHAIVTLNNDNFEYSVGTDNYYYVSVGFDLDSWK